MKNTPAPWKAVPGPRKKQGWDILNAKEVCVAMNVDERDAHLIAAAPELLAALKELREQASQAAHWVPHVLLLGAIDFAEKALAKAEGE